MALLEGAVGDAECPEGQWVRRWVGCRLGRRAERWAGEATGGLAGVGKGGGEAHAIAQRWHERAAATGEDAADDGDAIDAGLGFLGQGLVEAGEDLGAAEGVFRQGPTGDGDLQGRTALPSRLTIAAAGAHQIGGKLRGDGAVSVAGFIDQTEGVMTDGLGRVAVAQGGVALVQATGLGLGVWHGVTVMRCGLLRARSRLDSAAP
jgi:hypothetical protein